MITIDLLLATEMVQEWLEEGGGERGILTLGGRSIEEREEEN